MQPEPAPDTLPSVDFPTPLTPPINSGEYWYGLADCQEAECDWYGDEEAGEPERTFPCPHLESRVATWGDVFLRQQLEHILVEVRQRITHGERVEDLSDVIDSGLYETARLFRDEVDADHGGNEDLTRHELYGPVLETEARDAV